MVTVPEVPTPVTSPDASTLPRAALLLLHVPPVVPSDNVIIRSWPTLVAPDMAGKVTSAFTVTMAVVVQVLGAVKIIVAVPGDTPYTTPAALTVAVPTALEAHEVVVVRSDKIVILPTPHTERFPKIGVGKTFIVTFKVLAHPVARA